MIFIFWCTFRVYCCCVYVGLRSYSVVTTQPDPFPLLNPPSAPPSAQPPPPNSNTIVHPLTQGTEGLAYRSPRRWHSPFIFSYFASSRCHATRQKRPGSGGDPASPRSHLTCVSHWRLRDGLLSLLPAGGQLRGQICAWQSCLDGVSTHLTVRVRHWKTHTAQRLVRVKATRWCFICVFQLDLWHLSDRVYDPQPTGRPPSLPAVQAASACVQEVTSSQHFLCSGGRNQRI